MSRGSSNNSSNKSKRFGSSQQRNGITGNNSDYCYAFGGAKVAIQKASIGTNKDSGSLGATMSFQNRELGSSAGRSKQGHQSAAIGKSLSFAQGTATAGRRMQRIADNDSKLQERQRKKKLLMSDSLQMLTRHRNNQLAA